MYAIFTYALLLADTNQLGSPRLVLKPKEVALVHSPTLGEWTGAVRAHFLCSDKICGLEHSMTKVEWTSKPHEKLSGRRKWWVNLSLGESTLRIKEL